MLRVSLWRIITMIMVALISLLITLPSIITLPYGKPINLGLDLKGGASLLLELDLNHYNREQISRTLSALQNEIKKRKIHYTQSIIDENNIIITLRDHTEVEATKGAIHHVMGDTAAIVINDNKLAISFDNAMQAKLTSNLVSQTMEIIRRRIDENGTKEIDLVRQSDNYILLQVPGVEDPSAIKKLLGKTAKLSLHLASDLDPNVLLEQGGKIGYKILSTDSGQLITLEARSLLSGEMLEDAQVGVDQNGQPVVHFKWNKRGAEIFANVTRENVGKVLAIVLDNKIITAANINEPILGGSGQISGRFSIETANELALLLRAGSLPVPLQIVEERSIGPSLGQDSIKQGVTAAALGVLLVAIFMVLFYGIFGMVANIAMCFNLTLLIAVMVLLDATLTLPGIAGMVLTLGMAVDANVLIYERIKEEVTKGRTPISAIETGFKAAFATIVDSNITTILAALALYIFGSGPVKGFGVALSIGITCSMFTAVTLSRTMIIMWYRHYKPTTLPL